MFNRELNAKESCLSFSVKDDEKNGNKRVTSAGSLHVQSDVRRDSKKCVFCLRNIKVILHVIKFYT